MNRPSTRGKFDLNAFYRALDAVRRSRSLTWKQVAKDSGVPASSLTRMSQGKRPDVDTLATLCAWSSLNPADYMEEIPSSPLHQTTDTLAAISTCLSRDPNLDPASAEAMDILVKSAYENFVKKKQFDKT